MTDESRLVIEAVIANVEKACEFVAQMAVRAGLDEDGVHHCRLSVEEVVTNIIEHGYRNAGDGEHIEIMCRFDGTNFIISVIDDAPLFDPLAQPDPDPSTPLWERQGGGWGIYFVKKFMDRVSYSDVGQRNRLTMHKRV